MPRRTFRYDPESKAMIEVVRELPADAGPFVRDDIRPFVHDGTIIKSRSQLRDYMNARGLVEYDPAISQNGRPSAAQTQRERQALRERLWEGVSRTYSLGSKPRR